MDDDIILPSNFIELCIEKGVDCVGGLGYAELFKTTTFIELFRGKFPEVASDDTFIELLILASNKKFSKWPIKPLRYKLKKKHTWQYYYGLGYYRYKLGYDPIHILLHLRHGIMYFFYVIGYSIALLKREERYDFAMKI